MDEILMETGVSLNDFQEIKSSTRKRVLTQYKLKYAIEATENHYTLIEIGKHIGMTGVAIKDMMGRYVTGK